MPGYRNGNDNIYAVDPRTRAQRRTQDGAPSNDASMMQSGAMPQQQQRRFPQQQTMRRQSDACQRQQRGSAPAVIHGGYGNGFGTGAVASPGAHDPFEFEERPLLSDMTYGSPEEDQNAADRLLDAFEELADREQASFAGRATAVRSPKMTSASQQNAPKLYGYYGDAFSSANPSQELMEKERRRQTKKSRADGVITTIERALCLKYGIPVPKRYPNRKRDKGESGEQLMVLGETVNDKRNPRLWGITQEDRNRHIHLLGPSGSGKSTLLHVIGMEDMWYWRGGLMMEPHGDLCEQLLAGAPPYRIHDIIYLNVLDQNYSPGFNPLMVDGNANDADRANAVGEVETLIAKNFNMESGMVQLQRMLRNALTALSYVPGATILEVLDFYSNEDIRNSILSWMPDGSEKDMIQSTAENAKADQLGSLENRLQGFTTNRYLKHLFGQCFPTVDFYSLMNAGAYIICPMSKGETEDDSFLKFSGTYVTQLIYKAALNRHSIPEDDRVRFALTLDEFQNFMSDNIEGILSEARKYGLCLMLAHQYLDQLSSSSLQAAVLQNCSTKLVYNLAAKDAEIMAKQFPASIKKEDLMNIPKYHTMAYPLVHGGQVDPFISSVGTPLSFDSPAAPITESLIKEVSRKQYMRPRDDIEKEIATRKEVLASGNKEALVKFVGDMKKRSKQRD